MFNVILPCYNEVNNIIPMIMILTDIFEQLNKEYLLIVVDDNSPDGTAKEVKKYKNKNIKLIERPGKMGLGSAYMDASKECVYYYTIIIDVDLQHNPFDILGMVKYCKEYDIVSSMRYGTSTKYENGKEVFEHGKVHNWSFFRRLSSAIANELGRFVLDLKTHDLTGSFRIYKTNVFKTLLKEVKTAGFGFQMEMIARAEHKGCKIKEYPITFYQREFGESKMSIKDVLKFIGSVIQLYFYI